MIWEAQDGKHKITTEKLQEAHSSQRIKTIDCQTASREANMP